MEYTIVDEYIIKKRKKNYSCNFCNELFCRSDVLKKHLDRCKIRKEETQDKEIIYQELLKKMESYEKEKENQYNLIKELNNKIEKLENEKK
jgi:glutamate synthase domain-containing protein 2